MRISLLIILLIAGTFRLFAQEAYTASFIATMGTDTVIVETYNMLKNRLYGKAFLRYPEDQVALFDLHFYPDGSIQTYSISYMSVDNSAITTSGTASMLCQNDTCTWFSSWRNSDKEYVNKHAAKQMDFLGGWTPILSLIEWNCMRLIKSGKQSLPVTMLNDYIGVRHIAVSKGNKDTLIFGGPFLEYTKIKSTPEGKIISYDGTGTPWNYIANKLEPINVDEVAKRMSRKPKIGFPSPEIEVSFPFASDSIKISYGRPYKRGRKIFGGIVPYDSIWRTGAGHPTKINLPTDVQFGKTIIPKGRYSLYTIPRSNEWTLIFNTDLEQWPTDPNRSKDFAFIPLKVRKPAKQTDQFTIDIQQIKDGGIIKFTWDETEAYSNFKIINN